MQQDELKNNKYVMWILNSLTLHESRSSVISGCPARKLTLFVCSKVVLDCFKKGQLLAGQEKGSFPTTLHRCGDLKSDEYSAGFPRGIEIHWRWNPAKSLNND